MARIRAISGAPFQEFIEFRALSICWKRLEFFVNFFHVFNFGFHPSAFTRFTLQEMYKTTFVRSMGGYLVSQANKASKVKQASKAASLPNKVRREGKAKNAR